MMEKQAKQTQGLICRFENPSVLLAAARELHHAGYKKFDCYSPFPIHGMDNAMGLKRSPLGYIVFFVAMFAFLGGFALEWWTSTVDYPLVISGKPFFSYQAYGPVAFAVMVLSSAFVALIGMLVLNRLPRFFHPLFASKNSEKITDDGFFVSVESKDKQFDSVTTKKFLEKIGGKNVEVIGGE